MNPNSTLDDIILQRIEENVLDLLKKEAGNIMSAETINSPRAVGDAIQEFLADNFNQCVPQNTIKRYDNDFARRAMEDMAFTDVNDNYYVVDCKTHNLSTEFNMPNLISVQRLARLYEDDSNYFMVLFVEYNIQDGALVFNRCIFCPIEYLAWSCLTLGALGWGQIQIANSNIINVDKIAKRRDWMLQLCDAVDLFYPREISKIVERQNYFGKVRKFWTNHP